MASTMSHKNDTDTTVDVWDSINVDQSFMFGALVESKARLIGVPFIVTKASYNVGEYGGKSFVSLEAVTAPAHRFDTERVERARAAFAKKLTGEQAAKIGWVVDDYAKPNEHIVFNDGSTGIKRQVTAFLHTRGYITVDGVTGEVDLGRLEGTNGNSPFDANPDSWISGGSEAVEDGFELSRTFIVAMSGLRASAYDGDNGPGVTFYL